MQFSIVNMPSELPDPLADGYNYEYDEKFLRTNPDVMSPEVSREYADNQQIIVAVAWKFSREEMEIFRDFFDRTLVYGSRSFNMYLFLDGDVNRTLYTVNFIGPFTSRMAWAYNVGATLCVDRYQNLD